jgi:hypothetical protein
MASSRPTMMCTASAWLKADGAHLVAYHTVAVGRQLVKTIRWNAH